MKQIKAHLLWWKRGQGPEPLRQLSRTSRALCGTFWKSLYQVGAFPVLTSHHFHSNHQQSVIKFGLVEMYPHSSSNFLFWLAPQLAKIWRTALAPCVNAGTSKHLDFNPGLCSVVYPMVPKTGGIKISVVSALKLGKTDKQLLQPWVVGVDSWHGSTWCGNSILGEGERR